jgi:hypothetical protein
MLHGIKNRCERGLDIERHKTVYVNTVTKISIGNRGGTVVKVLCYKSEGRWFDSRLT